MFTASLFPPVLRADTFRCAQTAAVDAHCLAVEKGGADLLRILDDALILAALTHDGAGLRVTLRVRLKLSETTPKECLAPRL